MVGSRWPLFILSLFLIAGSSLPAGAQLPPPAIPVIVQITPAASITAIASAWRGTVVDSIPGADTYLLNVPSALPSLNLALPGVQWVELNESVSIPSFAVLGIVTVPDRVGAAWYKNQPAWQLIEAPKAQQYSKGHGIVVADINSLVDYSHRALVGHLTSGYDFVLNKPAGETALNQSEAGFLDQSEAGFLDQSEAGFLNQSEAGFLDSTGLLVNPAYGHGTLCAGVIAAMAPGSMIMPLRAFDDNGLSDIFTLAKAIRYAVQNGAQVINMSFGTYYQSNALQSAIEYAQKHDVLLAAAAGNDNTSRPQYPAAYSGVMTTAATNLLDKKAAFSNYGNDIFVDAPGVNIISAYPHGNYGIVSGTSFSAPAIAATAALVRSLRINGVAKAIARGAVNIDSQNPGYAGRLGYGRIDVLRSVDRK